MGEQALSCFQGSRADAWEEETQAERSSREERSGGHKSFAATNAQAQNACVFCIKMPMRRYFCRFMGVAAYS